MSELFDVRLEAQVVEAGGQLRGRLRIVTEDRKLEKAKSLVLKAVANVHGSGTSETVEVVLARRDGPFSAPFSMDFEGRLPGAPVSWQGRYVKVDWVFHAQLDVPWAVDPRIEVPFQLVPRKRREADAEADRFKRVP